MNDALQYTFLTLLPIILTSLFIQIALHHGTPCNPDKSDVVDTEKEADDLQFFKQFVSKTFPFLHPEPAHKIRCLYTVMKFPSIIIVYIEQAYFG